MITPCLTPGRECLLSIAPDLEINIVLLVSEHLKHGQSRPSKAAWRGDVCNSCSSFGSHFTGRSPPMGTSPTAICPLTCEYERFQGPRHRWARGPRTRTTRLRTGPVEALQRAHRDAGTPSRTTPGITTGAPPAPGNRFPLSAHYGAPRVACGTCGAITNDGSGHQFPSARRSASPPDKTRGAV